jgi:uncharacterized protein DUF6194
MDEASVREYIIRSFPDIEVVDASGGSFFFTDPAKKFPFATLVTSDEYDQASDLNRPGVWRLNVGVSKQTFGSLFGPDRAEAGEGGYDFTALDRIMPHPVYGKMHWVCVLNPSAETFGTVKGLLAEAYEAGKRQRARPASPGGTAVGE